jgi:hypothetical protein
MIYPPRPIRWLDANLEFLVDGRPLRIIQHAGRTYVPVQRLGAEYEIRVVNRGSNRLAALVAVDGLSVITGRPDSDDQPGYLVESNSSITIKGWRRNLDTVAAFTFNDREDSYAARRGHPEKIGIVTLLAIEEAVPHPRPVLEFRKDAPAGPKAERMAQGGVGGTGTGYGRDVDSRVNEVPFNRSANRRTFTYYYDTVANLRRAGVPVDGPPVLVPRHFEFAPPPPSRSKE